MSRRLLAVVAAVAVVAVSVAVGFGVGRSSSGDDGPEPIATGVGEVVRTDLVRFEEVDGLLGFGDPVALSSGGAGIVTRLADEGAEVDNGGVIWHVDERPVMAVVGDIPAYRTLSASVSDGPDVAQLERALRAAGYGDDLTVDDDATSATGAAIRRWQDDNGLAETGQLTPADMVVTPSSPRVSERLVEVGARVGPGTPVLAVTSTEPVVTLSLDAADRDLVAVDQEVIVELPDGTRADGSITEVGSVARPTGPEGSGDPVIDVRIVLAGGAADFDGAPVTVLLEAEVARDVLAVPVRALLALSEGGFAVERIDGDGVTTLVGVDTGAFVDSQVEVVPTSGDLSAGDRVVLPDR